MFVLVIYDKATAQTSDQAEENIQEKTDVSKSDK